MTLPILEHLVFHPREVRSLTILHISARENTRLRATGSPDPLENVDNIFQVRNQISLRSQSNEVFILIVYIFIHSVFPPAVRFKYSLCMFHDLTLGSLL
jgi:hypothetical protein